MSKHNGNGKQFLSDNGNYLSLNMLDALPDGIVITDDDGKIVFVNKYLQEMFGYQAHELLGKPIEMLMPARFADFHAHIRREFMGKRQVVSPIKSGREVTAHRRNGDEFAVELGLSVVENNDKKFLLCHVVEITVQQFIAQQQQQYEQVSAELEKEREQSLFREQLLAMFSHQIKSPLSTIMLATAMVERLDHAAAADNGRLSQYVSRIRNQVSDIQSMLGDLRTLNTPCSDENGFCGEVSDLSKHCEELVDQIRFVDQGKHRITLSVDKDMGSAQISPKILNHILINLLENAVKYSPDDSEIVFKVARKNTNAYFVVMDHGIGVPKQQQQQLFEPFFRASNVELIQGTGLGLSIAKMGVDRYGGSIELKSDELNGTTVYVRLPIFEEKKAQSQPVAQSPRKQEPVEINV